MKKKNTITVLLALVFAYTTYNWVGVFNRFYTNENFGFSFSIVLYPVLLVIGIAALIQFYATQFKKSQMLRAYLLFSLVTSFFSLLFYVFRISQIETVSLLQGVGREVVEVVIVCYSLGILVKERTPKVDAINKFIPAGKGTRFLNRLFDLLPILIVGFSYFDFLQAFFPVELGSFGALGLFPLEFILFVVYYTFQEHFFHTTFGKTVTNTTVVHVNGQYASFGTILLRSICRFIPFDALSFFSEKGWHDSISNTVVVSETYVEEQKP